MDRGVSSLVRMRKVNFRGILKQEGVYDLYGEIWGAELEAKGRSNRVTKTVSDGEIAAYP